MPTIQLTEAQVIEKQDFTGNDEVYFPVGSARAKWSDKDPTPVSGSTRFDYGGAHYKFTHKGEARRFNLILLDNIDAGEGAIVVFAAWEADTSTDDTRKSIEEKLAKRAEAAATQVPSAIEQRLARQGHTSPMAGNSDTRTLALPIPAAAIISGLQTLGGLGEEGVNLGKTIKSIKALFGSEDDFLGAVQFALYRHENKVYWEYTPLEGCDAGARAGDVLTVNFMGGKGGKYQFKFAVNILE